MSPLTRIDTLVQFSEGSATPWTDPQVVVPLGAIIIDTTNKVVKEGDGSTLFADLPVCLDYNFSGATSPAKELDGSDDNGIVIAKNSAYDVDATKLATILNRIASYQSIETAQASRFTAQDGALVVGPVTGGDEGVIAECVGGVYTPGTHTVAQLIADVIAGAAVAGQQAHISDIIWYTDSGLTQKAQDQQVLSENQKYWGKIDAYHDSTELENVDFTLSTITEGITIEGSDGMNKSALVTIFGGAQQDMFYDIVTISNGDIICVGSTYSETGTCISLIVKFDANFNVLLKKVFGGTNIDNFYKIALDSNDNIYVTGGSTSTTVGDWDGFIVKYDSSLNLLAQKQVGTTTQDVLFDVIVDSNDNIFCCGKYGTANSDAAIFKMDTSLNAISQKSYSSAGAELFRGLALDSQDNVIAVGTTGSGNNSALVVKFDNDLNILVDKIMGSTGNDEFRVVTIDTSDNIFCCGYTASEGVGGNDALVVKFDSNLNKLAAKLIGYTSHDMCYSIDTDSNGNVYTVGISYRTNEYDLFMLKFDNDLNNIYLKEIDTIGTSELHSVFVDSNDDVFITGYANSPGSALAIKLTGDLSADHLNTISTTSITFMNSVMTIADSGLTVSASGLALADSSYTVSDSVLVLSNSTSTTIIEADIVTMSRRTVPTKLLSAIYNDVNDDKFRGVAIDSVGNIIGVGQTTPSGSTSTYCLIVKFDTNFNVLARKTYGGAGLNDFLRNAVCDSVGNIFCCGQVESEGAGFADGIVLKLNSALNLVAKKVYGGAASSESLEAITVDSNDNVIVCGYTGSEGSGGNDGLIVKFDNSLAILNRKVYGGAGSDYFYGVAVDSNDNIFCSGSTNSEGAGDHDALIIKFDVNLTILQSKIYGGTDAEIFNNVTCDSVGNVICCGSTYSGHLTGAALVVKFDTNLVILSAKVMDGSGYERFDDLKTDSNNNIICSGITNSEGAGSYEIVIIKFDSDLVVLGKKTYGGVGDDRNFDIVIDTNDDIVIAGSITLPTTEVAALLTRLPSSLPKGIYTNKRLTSLVLSDSQLAASDVTLTLANSALTLSDSTMILSEGALTFADAIGPVLKDTTIMDAVSNVFEVTVGNVVGTPNGANVPVTFNVTTDDGDETAAKVVDVEVKNADILVSVYGGTSAERLKGVAVDSSNNIIVVGDTNSEGLGGQECLVVKFDSSLNILARKIYGGASDDAFENVVIDYNDNIICCGSTGSEGTGSHDALVVKFDTNLNILAKKIYGGTGAEYFYDVGIDINGNIFCCGTTGSEGLGNNDALVVKFDSSLNILAKKRYGGAVNDVFGGITTDSSGNIFCTSYTNSEGTGVYSCLVVKFDNDLNKLAGKTFSGAGGDYFEKIAVDSNDNVICTGFTDSEGAGSYDFLIVKFDNDLNKLAAKVYGGASHDYAYNVTVDSSDNVICVGHNYSEGPGDTSTLVTKFDNDLNVISGKVYGGTLADQFRGVITDSSDNIITVGWTTSEGQGSVDTLVVKFPSNVPSGTFVGTTLSSLTMHDSGMTLADSALTLADSALTLADSNLTQESDIIG